MKTTADGEAPSLRLAFPETCRHTIELVDVELARGCVAARRKRKGARHERSSNRRTRACEPEKRRRPTLASEPSKPRQRPTLPQGCPCNTIGPEELNFRVRDGNG